VDFDTPNARNASGRGGRTAAFKFYEIPDNLLQAAAMVRDARFRWVHRTLTMALLDAGELDGDDVAHWIERGRVSWQNRRQRREESGDGQAEDRAG
jgi:hypothetical protein